MLGPISSELGPGYCVECFKPLKGGEIICGPCQDECDGRFDHLKYKESNNGQKKDG